MTDRRLTQLGGTNLPGTDSTFSRRRLLQVGGAGAFFLAAGGLAGCGSGNSTDPNTSTGGGTPKRGGTLRVGATGGGSGDTLDAQNPLTTMDFLRVGALTEQLVQMNGKTGQPEMVLAESIEPNKDATEWTIRVKEGITFHNGKPLTAADVLFSLRRIEKNKYPGLATMGPLNLSAAKVMDDRTLRIPFKAPYSIFVQGLSDIFATRIVPVGFDPKAPIGTGPFKFGSFNPGERSSFPRFDGYWQEGKPYLDELLIINFDDETAQLNALQAGQVDLVNQLSSTSVPTVQSAGGQTVVSKTRGFIPLTMRMDVAPFKDNRVRQAMRLLVNRKDINEQVYGGLGAIGNDTFGAIDPAYPGAVPQREQDIEQAKSLLRAAGQSDLRVDLYSAPTGPSADSLTAVYATQAAKAGVKVNIKKQDATQFWSQSYLKVPFAVSFWNTSSYLTQAQQGLAKGAPWNETHQADPAWQKSYNEAIATVDATARGELVRSMIKYDYDNGGYIIPVYFPGIEGKTAKVGGVEENITGIPINGANWSGVWLEG